MVATRWRYSSVFLWLQVCNRNEPNKRGFSCEMFNELQLLSSSTVEATCGITLVCYNWHAMLKKVTSMSITVCSKYK